jgi:serine/threonine protein kinase
MMLMLYRIGFSVLPMALVAIEPVGLAVAATVLVERVRGLIHQSRQRDLLGKYILGKRIGSGGMAEVFLATYSPEGGFERRVAVKKILPSWAEDATSLALFRREAELGAMLNHPNLVHVLDFGFDGETYFIAMEYIDGCSLAQLLRAAVEAQQPLTLKEVTYIAWCLAEALHAIHEHPTPTGTPMHLVHRDVNPPNVMVSRAGEVKLADFGIAREVSGPSLTAVGVMRGKLSYSAPEQVLGQPFDCRADLFALGLSLHELLVGQRLFAGHTDLDIVKAAMHLSVLPPSATRPEVPAALDAIVMGLLERETSRRTPTAHALLQQLSQLNGDLLDVREGRALVAARALTTKATSIATMSSGDTHLGSGAGSGDLATQPGITPSGGSNLATATRATKL